MGETWGGEMAYEAPSEVREALEAPEIREAAAIEVETSNEVAASGPAEASEGDASSSAFAGTADEAALTSEGPELTMPSVSEADAVAHLEQSEGAADSGSPEAALTSEGPELTMPSVSEADAVASLEQSREGVEPPAAMGVPVVDAPREALADEPATEPAAAGAPTENAPALEAFVEEQTPTPTRPDLELAAPWAAAPPQETSAMSENARLAAEIQDKGGTFEKAYAEGTTAYTAETDNAGFTSARMYSTGQEVSHPINDPEAQGRWSTDRSLEALTRLTPEELQREFSLPEAPTHIADRRHPGGETLTHGVASENTWGEGGGSQIEARDAREGEYNTPGADWREAQREWDLRPSGTFNRAANPDAYPAEPQGKEVL